MKSTLHILTLMGFILSSRAQDVVIADLGLDAAIRDALQKPNGPLTTQDLLSLTNLNASSRNVSNIAGLEAARNLVSLELQLNHLTNFFLSSQFTNLSVLNLSFNSLTQCAFPDGSTNLAVVDLKSNSLTHITLPDGLTR